MPSLKVNNFGGIAPRISDRLLPPGAATIAENCKLWSGEIRPFRSPREDTAPLQLGFIESLYQINGVWLSWNKDVDVVRASIPGDTTGRIYYTGDGAPKVSNVALVSSGTPPYPTQAYTLGVTAPSAPPTLVLGGGGSGVPQVTFYIYTYVTSFGEEGPPSDPSTSVTTLNGQLVTVSGFNPPSSANVDRIRVYRTSTGTGTDYLFVDEIPVTQATYADATLDADLGERMVSQQWYPPPVNMVGLVGHPSGAVAGFVGNQLFISEAGQPHAFPPEYVKVVDYPIVALGVYGNTIVVTTSAFTYLVSGSDPRSMSIEKLPDPYPCVSKRSLVSGDRGVIFATNDGLIWVGFGGLRMITRDIITRDEWAEWNPTSMHGAVFDGRYVGFFLDEQNRDYDFVDPQGRGFIFDYNDQASGSDNRDKLTLLTFYATAVYASPDTNLHYVRRESRRNTLMEWEAGTGYLPYRWRSKALTMPYITTFAAAKVVGQHAWKGDALTGRNVEFSLWAGTHEKYRRPVTTSEPFRLPRFYRETEPWYLQVEGTEYVQMIHMATSMEDLREDARG